VREDTHQIKQKKDPFKDLHGILLASFWDLQRPWFLKSHGSISTSAASVNREELQTRVDVWLPLPSTIL